MAMRKKGDISRIVYTAYPLTREHEPSRVTSTWVSLEETTPFFLIITTARA